MKLESFVDLSGGVASRRSILAAGFTDHDLRKHIARRRLIRLRPGWFGSRSANPEVARALRLGGRLTCVSALKLQGAWVMPHAELHVRMRRGIRRPAVPRVRLHWSDVTPVSAFPMDAAADALRVAVGCLDRRAAIVAIDSVLQRGIVDRPSVEAVLQETARGRALRRLIDASAESGIETLARLGLRRARVRFRAQVPMPGVGRVDFLIGDRLVLEVDGEEWHTREEDFERDRARDRELVARGFLVMRATYSQVMTGWGDVEAQILRLVRRDAHLWPRRSR